MEFLKDVRNNDSPILEFMKILKLISFFLSYRQLLWFNESNRLRNGRLEKAFQGKLMEEVLR